MNEIRPIGPRSDAGGTPAGISEGAIGSEATGGGSDVTAPAQRGARYAEIAGLQRLRARMDLQYADVRVPPGGGLRDDLAGAPQPDPTLPHPASLSLDNRPMDLGRIHGIVRGFLADSPASGDGPRSEMNAVLRIWLDSRDRLSSRLATRG